MTYPLHILRRALRDIDEKFESLRRHLGRRSASNWRHRLDSSLNSLEQHPEVWPLADEAADLGIELCQMLFGKRRHVYRILYTFDGTTIHVHRVRHAAQDRLSSEDL